MRRLWFIVFVIKTQTAFNEVIYFVETCPLPAWQVIDNTIPDFRQVSHYLNYAPFFHCSDDSVALSS